MHHRRTITGNTNNSGETNLNISDDSANNYNNSKPAQPFTSLIKSASTALFNSVVQQQQQQPTDEAVANSPLTTKKDMATLVMNSCRDRTFEFQTTIRTFQSRMAINPQLMQSELHSDNSANRINRPNLQQRQQFMSIAKHIGRELTNTCIKLEKLTDLAKKRSLFDDKPKEIDELTFYIKQDINNLNGEIKRLQEYVKINKSHDSKNVQKHSSNVVYTLQSKLKNVSNDFKNILEVRTENLKKKNERGEQYFSKNTLDQQTAASRFAPPKMPGNQMGKSVLLIDDNSSTSSGLGSSVSGDSVLNMDDLLQKQQLQKRLIVNEDDSYLRDRADAMQTVEQTIIELGGIFQQLSTMIKEQEEQIQRIDSNVDDIELHVSGAHTELLKYFQSVTSNRWLMIKIFFVLIVFFVFFVVVMT